MNNNSLFLVKITKTEDCSVRGTGQTVPVPNVGEGDECMLCCTYYVRTEPVQGKHPKSTPGRDRNVSAVTLPRVLGVSYPSKTCKSPGHNPAFSSG